MERTSFVAIVKFFEKIFRKEIFFFLNYKKKKKKELCLFNYFFDGMKEDGTYLS